MTNLTSAQTSWLRSEVGSTVTDVDLQSKFDRLGVVRDVAIEVLRERRAKWLDQPLSVSVSGVASVNFGENVKAIERRIAALLKLDEDPSDNSPTGDGAAEAEGGVFEQIQLTRTRRR